MTLTARIERARSAIGHGIRYRLGQGGWYPNDPLPTRNGLCDCSGFVSWVLELGRAPKMTRWWWLETTAIWKDVTGKQKVFQKIDKPEPGCIVVFPDKNGHQGHIGLVSSVDGKMYDVIDCTSRGIAEHPGSYFQSRSDAVFAFLREDSK